jgi:hypothetical protein
MIMPTGDSNVDALLGLICKAAAEGVAEYARLDTTPSLIKAHPYDRSEDVRDLKQVTRVLEGACEQLCSSIAPANHTMINVNQFYGYRMDFLDKSIEQTCSERVGA